MFNKRKTCAFSSIKEFSGRSENIVNEFNNQFEIPFGEQSVLLGKLSGKISNEHLRQI